MPNRISTFLMFQNDDAEAAMRWYVELFDGRINRLERWAAGEPGKEGLLKLAQFEICGQRLQCSDSPVKHAFGFTPSTSLYVECTDEEEIARLFATLSEGGQVLMPLDHYGFSRRFGWCNDKYRVSWQLTLE